MRSSCIRLLNVLCAGAACNGTCSACNLLHVAPTQHCADLAGNTPSRSRALLNLMESYKHPELPLGTYAAQARLEPILRRIFASADAAAVLPAASAAPRRVARERLPTNHSRKAPLQGRNVAVDSAVAAGGDEPVGAPSAAALLGGQGTSTADRRRLAARLAAHPAWPAGWPAPAPPAEPVGMQQLVDGNATLFDALQGGGFSIRSALPERGTFAAPAPTAALARTPWPAEDVWVAAESAAGGDEQQAAAEAAPAAAGAAAAAQLDCEVAANGGGGGLNERRAKRPSAAASSIAKRQKLSEAAAGAQAAAPVATPALAPLRASPPALPALAQALWEVALKAKEKAEARAAANGGWDAYSVLLLCQSVMHYIALSEEVGLNGDARAQQRLAGETAVLGAFAAGEIEGARGAPLAKALLGALLDKLQLAARARAVDGSGDAKLRLAEEVIAVGGRLRGFAQSEMVLGSELAQRAVAEIELIGASTPSVAVKARFEAAAVFIMHLINT